MIDLANLAFENELKEQFGNKKLLWNKKILDDNGGLQTFRYENYMTDKDVLKEALKAILKYGAVLINNVVISKKFISFFFKDFFILGSG